MRETFFIIILVSLLHSCKTPSTAERAMAEMKKEKTFFDPVELGSGGSNGNFIIKAYIDDCGEWGGHYEELKLYALRREKEIHLSYKKTNVDCNLQESDSTYSQDTIVSKTIKLNKANERAIVRFLNELTNLKITSRFPGHAGNEFEVIKSDSTFYMKLYDGRKASMKNYTKLLENLNLNK
jgi:hypothetical protein